jgi:hypothetical protein
VRNGERTTRIVNWKMRTRDARDDQDFTLPFVFFSYFSLFSYFYISIFSVSVSAAPCQSSRNFSAPFFLCFFFSFLRGAFFGSKYEE